MDGGASSPLGCKPSPCIQGGASSPLDCKPSSCIKGVASSTAGPPPPSSGRWFNFRVSGVRGLPLSLQLVNAGKASFPEAWHGYNACASYDLVHWFRWRGGEAVHVRGAHATAGAPGVMQRGKGLLSLTLVCVPSLPPHTQGSHHL